ncbi:MAG: hypothetical protein J6W46_06705 [Spirochaetaceae bacterium]|nr:hypothetical protein [Spirochaetaceae bacterium]
MFFSSIAKKNGCFALAVIAVLFLFSGCETSVPVNVTRPADLDITAAERIAVLPFLTTRMMNYTSYDTDPVATFDFYWREKDSFLAWQLGDGENEFVTKLTSSLERALLKSNYLTVVDSGTVEDAYRRGRQPPIDWYVTGGISELTSEVEKIEKEVERKDKEGNKYKVKVPYYRETVDFSLVYQVVDVNTRQVLANTEWSYKVTSDDEREKKDLPMPGELAEKKISDFVSRVMREFEPYDVSYSLTLLKHDDRAMKDAEKLARKGKLAQAKTSYLQIYRSTQYFEAAYNAGLVSQAMGNMKEAYKIFSDLYKATGDSRAAKAANSAAAEIRSSEKLNNQTKFR